MGTRLLGVPIRHYATDAAIMAESVLTAYRRFGYDGLQLSLGVATEAGELGSSVHQPEDGLPVVVEPALESPGDLARLEVPNPWQAGRMALFLEAVERAVQAVGEEAWIVAGIRGPFLMGSQLRGVESLLMDLIDQPDWTGELLTFTTEVGLAFGRALIEVGAHAISIGEATCSPDFINPVMYR